MATARTKPGKQRLIGFIHLPTNSSALLLTAIAAALIPLVLHNDYLLLLFNILALNALVVLGLNLLIAATGQVSLGHAAFYGLGAYISAIAGTTWQWPLVGSFLFSLVLVAAISFLVAIPTLRLEGHYLVMATLGINIIVTILLGQLEWLTGGPSGFPGIPRLHLGTFVIKSDRQFYFFIWGLFLLMTALTLNLSKSRLGRAFHAIHDKELTAKALGIPTYRYKVIAFVLSALYAATAGFCYAHYVTFISPKTFDIFHSIQVVTMVAVGGMGNLWGGLAGAALLTCLPELLHSFEDVHVLLYGIILMGVLVFCPQGLLPVLIAVPKRLMMRRNRPYTPQPAEKTPDDCPPGNSSYSVQFSPIQSKFQEGSFFSRNPADNTGQKGSTGSLFAKTNGPLLQLHDVSLSFGGLQALGEVGMEVFPGEVVALIGPNGAGKTTILNVVSGLLKPDSGSVLMDGRSILGQAPHRLAARGIGRTFQAVQIYSKLTPLDNVLLGFHIHGRAGFLAAYLHTVGERREEKELRQRALNLLDSFGLADKAFLPAEQLTLLEEKLLELARALALSPRILLLDEPVGGLNARESQVLVECISMLRSRGMGIVLVEHDMNVVMRLSDRIVVLQHGCRIAVGTPQEIQQHPEVIAAYLGVKK
ncbi:MAG: ATP-binding cassette domain-containing protein [Syntrophobacteraceae bacterium]